MVLVTILNIKGTLLSQEIKKEALTSIMQKFNVKDEEIAREIAELVVREYGVKDIAEERIIDRIAEKHGIPVEEVAKFPKINIKIGTLAPPSTPWFENAVNTVVPFIKWHSRNIINITIYGGGVMGEDTDILRKMALGQLQGCGCTALGVFTAVPEMSVFNLPLLFENYEEVDYILRRKFRKEIEEAFQKRGYVLLSLIDTGFFYLYTKSPFHNFEDLKKLRPVTWFGEVEMTFFREAGITKVTRLNVPEVVISLQSGIIDSSISPPAWWMGTQAFRFSKYFLKAPLFYSPAAIFLSRKYVDEVTRLYPPGTGEKVIELTYKIMKIYEKEWNRAIREFEERCQQAFKEGGMTEIELKDEDKERLKSASMKTWDDLSGKLYSPELLEKIKKELENYRQKRR